MCDPGRMIQLVCRFRADDDGFDERSSAALALLAAQPTCLRLLFARSTEDPAVRVLTAEFASFPAYRSALSPFEVRTVVIPFLSEAEPSTSSVLEVVLHGVDGRLVELDTVVDPAAVSRAV